MAKTLEQVKEEIEPTMSQVKSAYLKKEFVISQDALFDYYSTNSGMFARNPTIGGSGGGGGEGDLSGRVDAIEEILSAQSVAAESAKAELSSMIPENQIDEIDDLVNNQKILSGSQTTILNSMLLD